VAALEEWRKLLQEHGAYFEDGSIFPTLHTSGEHACREYRIGNAALSTNAFRAMLKRRCAAIGIDPREIGGHSLRAGHATQAAENGVDILEIAQQGRWRDLRKVQVYVRSGRRFSFNSSGKLGL
jgi:integrase